MSTPIRIQVRTPLPNYNEYTKLNRTNKYLAAKVKREVEDAMIWELKEKGTPPLPEGVKNFHFTWYEPNKRQNPDNIHSRTKFILDALVKGGWMNNDGWGDVGEVRHSCIAPSKQYVDIIITTNE